MMRIFKTTCLISFILLSGIFLPVSAQQFHGGLTAGIVGSQVTGDTYSGYKKAGVYVGGFVSIDISDRSAFQMELTYFQKGARENPSEKNNYGYLLFRANYIEMPVLYQFKTGKERHFIFEVGPSVGFLMGYFEENEVHVVSDLEGYNKPATLSLQINLGIRWMISTHFGVDFRIHESILNIRENNVTGDVRRFWWYGQFHDALVLSLYYQIR